MKGKGTFSGVIELDKKQDDLDCVRTDVGNVTGGTCSSVRIDEARIKEILKELLSPITKNSYRWGSYTHGHLGTDGKGLLPWYYLKYDDYFGEKIYNEYFAQYEESKGEENNNFFTNYRYFDIDLFDSFDDIKDTAKTRIRKIANEIKEIIKLNPDKIIVEFNEEGNHCRYRYGNIIGTSPIREELLKDIKEHFNL